MDERARRVFRSFMVGSAVAATLASLEAANHPALALTGLTATPSSTASGSSSPVTVNWTLTGTSITSITVNIGGFTTTANPLPGNCLTSAITVQVDGSAKTTSACSWNTTTNTFTLTVSPAITTGTNAALTFPAGTLVAGSPGTTQMLLSDDGAAPTATNTISFTSGSSPYPPDWFQSYQRGSAVEACQTTWNPSWAMWANNGTGGFVCVRTTYFDPRLSTWSYR